MYSRISIPGRVFENKMKALENGLGAVPLLPDGCDFDVLLALLQKEIHHCRMRFWRDNRYSKCAYSAGNRHALLILMI